MPRGLRLSFMLASTTLLVLVGFGAWLRRAPELPPGCTHITPGMTIDQIENLLGKRLHEMASCTGGAFCLVLSEPTCGLVTCVDVSTSRHSIDPISREIRSLAREEQTCRRIDIMRWSRFDWLNRQEWAWDYVLGLPRQ